MTVKLNTTLRNSIVDGIVSYIGGIGNGQLRIYTGSAPADPNSAATGTLLVTIDYNNFGLGASSAGSAALGGNETGVAVATGTAGWGRWSDVADTYRVDGSVGTGGTDFIITNTTITNGGTVTLTGCTLSQPVS